MEDVVFVNIFVALDLNKLHLTPSRTLLVAFVPSTSATTCRPGPTSWSMVSGSVVGGRGNSGDAFVKSWPCGRGHWTITDTFPGTWGQIFGGGRSLENPKSQLGDSN